MFFPGKQLAGSQPAHAAGVLGFSDPERGPLSLQAAAWSRPILPWALLGAVRCVWSAVGRCLSSCWVHRARGGFGPWGHVPTLADGLPWGFFPEGAWGGPEPQPASPLGAGSRSPENKLLSRRSLYLLCLQFQARPSVVQEERTADTP